jgi:putative ABC transport system permease protein
MTILTLPIRYIKAKWLRTLLLIAIFTLGLASMSGLYQISNLIADNMEKKLISYGANILVTPQQQTLKISYGGYSLGDVTVEEQPIRLSAALTAIDTMPLRANIAVIAPKMLAMTRVSNQAAALVGVDWEQELQLKGYWEVKGSFPEMNSASDILAGAVAADKLGLTPGQSLNLGGRNLHVSGVLLPTGSDDDTVIFASLALAQDLAGKADQASFMEVAALCSGCPIEDIVTQLQAALPDSDVRALAQVAESRMYSVHFAQNLAFSVSLVILITACAMLVMSMLSSVAERRREIGIMRAVGFSGTSVFTVFVSEAVGIGFMAGVSGYALGQLLTVHVLRQLHLADTIFLTFEAVPFVIVVLSSSIVAGASAAFPAWRASLTEPAEALVSL